MGIGEHTKAAIVMLLQADAGGDSAVRHGLLGLLGAGPAAMPAGAAEGMLRLIGERGAVMSPAAAAAALGVRRETLHKWERAGKVTLRRIRLDGKRVGIPLEDVAEVGLALRRGKPAGGVGER